MANLIEYFYLASRKQKNFNLSVEQNNQNKILTYKH